MNIIWDITDNDVKKVKNFVAQNQNPFLARRISRNINHDNIQIDKNSILNTMMMCLLSSQQRSGPNTPFGIFIRKTPSPFTIENISQQKDVEEFIIKTLKQNGLTRYINNISGFFTNNYELLLTTQWRLLKQLKYMSSVQTTIESERTLADELDDAFKGFGPKQARNFLQTMGLTKFEIPIDSRITDWLNTFGFPVRLTSAALQDKGYYHFVSDGIQNLCNRANIYPCVFDAAIFSSFNDGEWTEENTMY